jgi:hypothetical protein
LIVEDDAKIAAVLRDYLVGDGRVVDIISDGNGVVEFVRANRLDLVLLAPSCKRNAIWITASSVIAPSTAISKICAESLKN